MRRLLAGLNARRHVTIILTTHDISDVERLCRRILIIDHGRVIYVCGLRSVVDRFEGKSSLVVGLEEP
jgi:ABC-2 type transport system ATP-binding protein